MSNLAANYDANAAIRQKPLRRQLGEIYDAINPDGTEKRRLGSLVPTAALLSPAVGADGTVYIGSGSGAGSGGFFAIAPDGTQKWSTGTQQFQISAAIGGDGTVYTGTYNHLGDGQFFAFNPNGSTKWSFIAPPRPGIPPANGFLSSPAVAGDDSIYASCENGFLYALNPDGSKKWSFAEASPDSSCTSGSASPAIGADGTIYLGVCNNFYAIH